MKHLITTLALLWAMVSVSTAQTKLRQGFDGGVFPPLGWQATTPIGTEFWQQSNESVHSGAYSAFIHYDCASSWNEHWLISPKASISAGDTLKFWFDPYDYEYPDSFTVWISTTDSLISSFTATVAHYSDFPGTSGAIGTPYIDGWQEVIIPLDSFAGQDIFVAIKHMDDCGDGIFVDDFYIGQPAPACSGAPVAGTILVGKSAVCPGFNTAFEAIGATEGQGIVYQWQESDDNGVYDAWAPVVGGIGATSTSYATPGLNQPKWYRLMVTCNNTFLSDVSSSVKIGMDSFFSCYCSGGLGGNCWQSIANVNITGGSLNNSSVCSNGNNTNVYTSYPIGATTSDTVTAGASFELNVTPTEQGFVGAWVDFNRNGVFEPSEYTEIAASTTSMNPVTKSINVPLNAVTGYVGMRIRTAENWEGLYDGDACANKGSGETEDYVLYIEPAPVCNGTPVGGTMDTMRTTCAGTKMLIEAIGATRDAGIEYQWEESDDNGITDMWADVGVGNDSTFEFMTPPVTTAVYYRLRVTCLASAITEYSNSMLVYPDSFYNCYCKDDLGGSCWGGVITEVSITGGTLANSTWCSTSPAPSGQTSYVFFPISSTTSDTITAGGFTEFNVTSSDDGSIGIWIDADHNSVYDDYEFTLVSAAALGGSPTSVMIQVPITTATGNTGMRVRYFPSWMGTIDAYSACNFAWDGEIEDYLIYVEPAPICSGTPNGGTLPATQPVCMGNIATLIPMGGTTDNSISFQWEESDDDGVMDPWAPASGDSSNYSYVTGPVTTEMYYRLKITCDATAMFAYSSVVKVYPDSFFNCYCTNGLGGNCWQSIAGVSITNGNLNNPTACSGGNNVYASYPPTGTTTDTLSVGSVFELTVVPANEGYIGVWIDYDHSGTFDDVEYTEIANNTSSMTPESAIITIPQTALPGYTGMRIRTTENWEGLSPYDPCIHKYSGEVEDYVLLLEPAVACAGAPAAGTLPATATTCEGNSMFLMAEGASTDLDIQYQWEESDDDGVMDPWANVVDGSGDTSYIYRTAGVFNVRYYRLKVTCVTAAQSSYSNSVRVYPDSFYNCYCKTGLGGHCWNGVINEVSITGGTLSNSTGCSVIGGSTYVSYPVSSFTTDTVTAGSIVEFNVTSSDMGYSGVWIDYDHNGSFDASEYTEVANLTNPGGMPATAFLQIPLTATPGTTGLRVRYVSQWSGGIYAGDACSYMGDGETEDYMITIEAPMVCSGIPAPGVLKDTIAYCRGNSLKLIADGATTDAGISYQWEESDDNGVMDAWTNVTGGTGDTSYVYYTVPVDTTRYYRLKVTCDASASFDYSNPVLVYADSFYNCYCTSNLGGTCYSWNGWITNVSIANTSLNNGSTCNVMGNTNYIHFPPSPTTTDTILTGSLITFKATSSRSGNLGVWIDFDHSGSFDPSEYTMLGNPLSNAGLPTIAQIAVPANALTGNTNMRVRYVTQWNFMGASDACTFYYDGETEDYTIYIDHPPVCSSTPVGGTLPATVNICPGTNGVIVASGASIELGTQYQWEESDDNGVTDPWTDVTGGSGDTTMIYTTDANTMDIYYRLRVTCSNTMLSSYSTSSLVDVRPHYECYCKADLGGSNCGGDNISNVRIYNTPLFNSSGCASANNSTYQNFVNAGPGATATLYRNVGYQVEVATSNFNTVGVWIDYDQSGTFDDVEFTSFSGSTTPNVPLSSVITIPSTAMVGKTGMRVRTNSTWNGVGPYDACYNYYNGETEDYLVTIDTMVSVPTIQAAGVTAMNVTNNTVDLSWTRGDGNACIVVGKPSAASLTDPTDGLSYNASPIYGYGESIGAGYVLYNGTGTSITVGGLASGTNYDFHVYEYSIPGNSFLIPGATSGIVTTTPVKLISFKGIKSSSDAILTWATASEDNNKGFDIERSEDGVHFTKIGFVKGTGTTSIVSKYNYTDRGALGRKAVVYYRLKQIDFDGVFAYSSVVKVTSDEQKAQEVAVYPNPTQHSFKLDILSAENAIAEVTLTDMRGAVISSGTYTLQKGGNTFDMDALAGQSGGMYFLRVVMGDEVQVIKISKVD